MAPAPRHEALLARARSRPPLGTRPGELLVQAATAALRERATNFRQPISEPVSAILKAATSPMTMTDDGEALAREAVADFLATLGPASAASQLMAAGLNLPFGSDATIRLPSIITSAVAGLVAEGQPIPAVSLGLTGPTMERFKLGILAAFTSETLARTSALEVVRTSLRESAALSLDALLFSTVEAEEGVHPGGLLHGATSVTAATGGAESAMVEDLAALAAAVAGVGGTSVAFVASPAQAVAAMIRAPQMPFPIFASQALAAGTVAAFALPALAFATGAPDFDTRREATIHASTEPAQISTAGDPAVAAAPVVSHFQSDMTGLRMLVDIGWAKRASGSVAVLTEATW